MKNTLLALLGFILLSRPLAATGEQFGDFTYISDGSTITITGYTGSSGAVTIPDTIAGLPVSIIGNAAFQYKPSLTSVTIPATVTSIGNYAFSYSGLTSVTIPGSVTCIGAGAFYGCSSLIAVTIPGTVTGIGDYAFEACSSLTSVAIPVSVTSIRDGVFRSCYGLSSVTMPGSVTSIGYGAFSACYSLTNVMIPGSVNRIGDRAFEACTGLTSVTIPVGVTNIGHQAFAQCYSLTSVTIPNGVTSIGNLAFSRCTSLLSITVDVANASYSSLDGVLFNKSQTTLIQYPGGKAGSYLIPSSVRIIAHHAFAFCASLTNVTIPGSVISIENYAFYDCTSLTAVFFKGNRPPFSQPQLFSGNITTIYYLGFGWGATFAGRPAVLWNPLMQTSGAGFGVGPAGFGFNITGTADIPIVVEASTTLANADWVALQSLNLTNGAFYFSDPDWTNYPARNYRIRSP